MSGSSFPHTSFHEAFHFGCGNLVAPSSVVLNAPDMVQEDEPRASTSRLLVRAEKGQHAFCPAWDTHRPTHAEHPQFIREEVATVVGLPTEDQESIFSPFAQSKDGAEKGESCFACRILRAIWLI